MGVHTALGGGAANRDTRTWRDGTDAETGLRSLRHSDVVPSSAYIVPVPSPHSLHLTAAVRRHADFATSVAALRVALGEVQRGAEGDALRAAWAAVLHPPEQRSVRCSFGGEAGAGRRARGGAGRAAVERQVKEMVAGLVDEAGGARAVADLQARATWLAGVAGQLDAGASLAEATYAPEIIAKGLACAEEVVWARAAEGVPWVAALVGTWEDLARWGGGAQRHGPADRVAVQAFAGEESDCAWVAAVAVRPFPAGLREGLASSLAPSSLGRVREYLEEDALPDMMRLQDNTGWYVEGTSQGEAVRRSDPRWAAGVPEGGLQVRRAAKSTAGVCEGLSLREEPGGRGLFLRICRSLRFHCPPPVSLRWPPVSS